MTEEQPQYMVSDVRPAQAPSSSEAENQEEDDASEEDVAYEVSKSSSENTVTPPRAVLERTDLSEDDVLLSWMAPEFVQHERSRIWFIIAGVVIVLFIGGSIYFRSPLAAVLFGLIGVLVFLFALRKPHDVYVGFTQKGLYMNDSHYSYSALRSFWIFYEPDIQELSLATKRPIIPYLRLQLGEMDPVLLREFLLQHNVKEVEQEESFSDVLARRLKF